jgi:hypothetical protein
MLIEPGTKIYGMFHALWTTAVGTPSYSKRFWEEFLETLEANHKIKSQSAVEAFAERACRAVCVQCGSQEPPYRTATPSGEAYWWHRNLPEDQICQASVIRELRKEAK